MKKLFTISAIMFVFTTLSAQSYDTAYTNRINHIFQYMDKTKVTSGLLSDYGIWIVDPAAFNGTPADSNYVKIVAGKLLYLPVTN